MCQAFSCIVMRSGTVYWEEGIDSHDSLISNFKIRDDTTDMEEISHAKVEIIPDSRYKYPYLHPDGKWGLQIDERVTPSWLLDMHRDNAWKAFAEWKEIVYSSFNWEEALKPFNPLKGKPKQPTDEDMELLKRWDSVRDSVGDSVEDSVGDSVRDSVGDSVWAYIGSLFPNISGWKYINHKEGEYPFQPAVVLWKRGFIASYDNKIWRLHSGKKAEIVYEMKK